MALSKVPEAEESIRRQEFEFHVNVPVWIVHKTKKPRNKKADKAERDDVLRQLKTYVCALGNSGGGILWVQIEGMHPADRCMDYFHELVDCRLNHMIPDGILFSKRYLKDWVSDQGDNSGLIKFVVSPSVAIVTLDYKTKEPFDNCMMDTSSSKINAILKYGLKFDHTQPSIRGLSEHLQERRDVQVKSLFGCEKDECLKDMMGFIKYLWEDLKLGFCVTAFSKIDGGGSFYLGINECDFDRGYKTKILEKKGFKFPKGQHKAFIAKLKANAIEQTTVLTKKEEKGYFTGRDLLKVQFHPVDGNDTYILEVAVAGVEGIVFYDREGPESYEVDISGKIKRIPKEKWYIRQNAFAMGFTCSDGQKETEPSESTSIPCDKFMGDSCGNLQTESTARLGALPFEEDQLELNNTEKSNVCSTDESISLGDLRKRLQQLELENSNLTDEVTTLKQTEEELSRMLDSVSLGGLSFDSGASDISSLASWTSESSFASSSSLNVRKTFGKQREKRGLLKNIKKRLSFKTQNKVLPEVGEEVEIQKKQEILVPTYIDQDESPVFVMTDKHRRSPLFLQCSRLVFAENRANIDTCYVSEDGALLNRNPTSNDEKGKENRDYRRFVLYWGTCSTTFFLFPPIQNYTHYWEARIEAETGQRDALKTPLVELGVCEEKQMDKENLLCKQTRSWCICVAVCDVHNRDICIQSWSNGDHVSCKRDILFPKDSRPLTRSFGIVVDLGNRKVVFTDVERRNILQKFHAEFRDTVFPMFGVSPWTDENKVKIELVSGNNISITDEKQQLIYSCMQ